MRILAAADIHGDQKLAERLAQKAEREKVDLVVLCGDITGPGEATDNLIGHFKRRNEKVLLIPVNH